MIESCKYRKKKKTSILRAPKERGGNIRVRILGRGMMLIYPDMRQQQLARGQRDCVNGEKGVSSAGFFEEKVIMIWKKGGYNI